MRSASGGREKEEKIVETRKRQCRGSRGIYIYIYIYIYLGVWMNRQANYYYYYYCLLHPIAKKASVKDEKGAKLRGEARWKIGAF